MRHLGTGTPHPGPDRQIDAIGVDEIQYAKDHQYLTLVYQIDIGITRLLWVGKGRTIESFQGCFSAMGQEVIAKIAFRLLGHVGTDAVRISPTSTTSGSAICSATT